MIVSNDMFTEIWTLCLERYAYAYSLGLIESHILLVLQSQLSPSQQSRTTLKPKVEGCRTLTKFYNGVCQSIIILAMMVDNN